METAALGKEEEEEGEVAITVAGGTGGGEEDAATATKVEVIGSPGRVEMAGADGELDPDILSLFLFMSWCVILWL